MILNCLTGIQLVPSLFGPIFYLLPTRFRALCSPEDKVLVNVATNHAIWMMAMAVKILE